MDVRMLGPFEVRADGRGLDLGGPRPRALLAILLVNLGEVVAADRLVDELWGEAPPRSAQHLLHVYVSSLRKQLGTRLVTRPPGYVVELDPEEVDARRFERMLGDGRRLVAAGDAETAARTLGAALALWRGPALADFTYEPFAQTEITRLHELRLVAREERIEAELVLGRHGELIAELEALVAENPLRERPRDQLMRALYRCGRQAEALDAYRAARRLFVDELGIEPSPALKRLERAILRQDPALELDQPAAEPAAPARKLVTVAVASVAGGAVDGLDAEARASLLHRTFVAATASFERHGAAVERLPDERVLAVFGVPVGHEDDALRAVRAARELHDTSLGVGVECGEAVVDGPSIDGDAIPRAARLSAAAGPGDVLLGDGAFRLVRHAVRTRRGAAGARRVVALLGGAQPLPRRLDAALIGRDRELATLRSAFDGAKVDRASRVVTVVGDAGVGKSRLAEELAARLDGETRVLVARCAPYGEGTAYSPVRELCHQARVDSVDALRALLPPDARDAVLAAAAPALGFAHPSAGRDESLWALGRVFEALARDRPALFVLEDLHWAEQPVLALVEFLAERPRPAPFLLVCLARPELLELRPAWDGQIWLEPLPPAETLELLDELTGSAPITADTRAEVARVAEGNPLFLEQLLAMLVEDPRAVERGEIPQSLRAVVAARIDRLGPAERAVLGRASVVGRDVERDAVASLLPDDAAARLDRHLETLVRRRFLRRTRDELAFWHALVREVAYRALPKRLRADLHERLGEWVEDRGERDELVGYHLEQSFRLRDELHEVDWHARRVARRAVERLGRAGRLALIRDDAPTAANLLTRATSLPDGATRAELLPDLVDALRELPDLERAEHAAADAFAAASDTGDERLLALARIERAHVSLMSGRADVVENALAEGRAILDLVGDRGDPGVHAKALRLIALAHRLRGEQSERRRALERALELAQRAGDRRAEARIADGLGGVHNYGPSTVSELLRFADWSLRRAREVGDRFNELNALAQGFGRSYAMLGDFEAARRSVDEAKAIAADLGLVWCCVGVASAGGFVETLAGDHVAAESELREGYELAKRAGMTGSYFAMAIADELAQTLYALGKLDEASVLNEASEASAPADDVQAQVQWRCLRAKLLARAGRFDEAEEVGCEAVRLVERTEFLIVHANALVDLAEVLALAGEDQSARPLLEQALALFRRKGDRVSAARVEAGLAPE